MILSVLFGGLFCVPVFAGAAQWSTTNIQYLYGRDYDRHQDTLTIITLEHVNGWSYGDTFLFVDISNPDRSKQAAPTGFYAEISPRLSFGKLLGRDVSNGIISDILFTSTAEMGQGYRAYLYGLAVDLALPKFSHFQVNWYVRNQMDRVGDAGQQITIAWGVPFQTGALDWRFEGFADYAFDIAGQQNNLISGPRLLLDLGKIWGSSGVLQTGIAGHIWRNKFGFDGFDDEAAQVMLKWIW